MGRKHVIDGIDDDEVIDDDIEDIDDDKVIALLKSGVSIDDLINTYSKLTKEYVLELIDKYEVTAKSKNKQNRSNRKQKQNKRKNVEDKQSLLFGDSQFNGSQNEAQSGYQYNITSFLFILLFGIFGGIYYYKWKASKIET